MTEKDNLEAMAATRFTDDGGVVFLPPKKPKKQAKQ